MSLHAQLAALEASFLLQLETSAPELAYAFRHVLTRDAVYSTLVRRERSRLHLAVGSVLESLYAGQAETLALAPQLGAHFAEAGDDARALKYFTLAGDQAARQYANREAAQYYGRALQFAGDQPAAPLAHLYQARGQALELCGDYVTALAGYEAMLAEARQRRDQPLELLALTELARLANEFTPVADPARGEALLAQALQLARRRGDGAAEAHLLLYGVRKFVWTLETDKLVDYGEQAVAAARALNLTPVLIAALTETARWGYINRQQLQRAQETLDEARQLLQQQADPNLRLENLITLGMLSIFTGSFERTRQLLPELQQVSRDMSYDWGLAQYHTIRGGMELEQGQLGAAIHDFEEGTQLGSQFSVGQAELIACAFLSRACCATGEIATGLAAVQQARAVIEARVPTLLAWPLAGECLLRLAAGQGPQAAEVFAQARQVSRRGDTMAYWLMFMAESELRIAQGDFGAVVELTAEVIQTMRAEAGQLLVVEALFYRGQALLGLGDLEPSRAALREARTLSETLGLRLLLWRVLPELAAAEAGRGNPDEAQRLRAALRALTYELTDSCGTYEQRASFLATPAAQRALA